MARNVFSQLYASILINAIYAMKNYPIMLVNTLLAPLSILVIITFVSHGSLLDVGIMGALINTMMSSGISLQGDLSHLKNDFKLQDMVVSSPTSAFIYIFGMAISELVYSVPAIVTILILASLFVKMTVIGALSSFVALSLVFTFSIALGFTLSTFTSDVMQSWAFSGIISTLFSTIPPVYYPITYIPMPYRYLAYISPTTYAAEIVQNAIGFVHLAASNLAIDWAVLIAISIVLVAISAKKSRWREV
ncbi:MAG: ABC transporter permease [Candidatus Micrarchaeaceae archaeon]